MRLTFKQARGLTAMGSRFISLPVDDVCVVPAPPKRYCVGLKGDGGACGTVLRQRNPESVCAVCARKLD